VTEQVIAITRCVSWALMPQKRGSGGAYSAGFEGAASPAYAYKTCAGLL